ncbi:PqqD family protein [Afipia carboxidovorans]|uniref:PqqD family protein n=1 Tax=Afipia carboxidovorans TaxID=40137 RepID=UPI0030913691|nr:hypothetical protein CRBSH125_23220 [Afipia carboxidovorans]
MSVQLTPGTSLTTIEGKSVLFSVKTGESYGLNDMAAEMLKLCLEGGVDHAAERLAQDYNAPLEEIRNDINELTRDLVQAKLVRLVS